MSQSATLRERFSVGQEIQAFDPRTLGVVKHGRIITVGRKWLTVDFGLTGSCRIAPRDVVQG